MEIARHIVDESKIMLNNSTILPAEIKCAPGFFLALHNDKSVHAFSSVEVAGIFYKIGVLKQQPLSNATPSSK